eukprot:CAMPEP_0116878104 /NCGR_PEP_ID=MMETSP0463-20121206/9842_1 /TAXON_ID=181622 /ORGANISM="Strombidinopsis sp, Strain SopsisLIS2011" /LENGTH=44 /DNA_ID= /DNA_START= /DNA_END= /DNA_ORIENTATION=
MVDHMHVVRDVYFLLGAYDRLVAGFGDDHELGKLLLEKLTFFME